MRVLDDFSIAAGYLTRLPLFSSSEPVEPARLAQALRTAPAVGALVGLVAGGTYWLMTLAGLSTFASAVIAVAVTVAAYGGRQDMAIARAAEIYWGRKSGVEINQSGYDLSAVGAAAALLSILMKIALLESIGEPGRALAAITTACALGQAGWVWAASKWPDDTVTPLSIEKPSEDRATFAVVLALVVAAVVGWMWGVFAALGAALTAIIAVNMLRKEPGMDRDAAMGAVQGKAEVRRVIAGVTASLPADLCHRRRQRQWHRSVLRVHGTCLEFPALGRIFPLK